MIYVGRTEYNLYRVSFYRPRHAGYNGQLSYCSSQACRGRRGSSETTGTTLLAGGVGTKGMSRGILRRLIPIPLFLLENDNFYFKSILRRILK